MDQRERESIELGLASSDEELRRLAVERLGALSVEVALPRLVGCLGDPSWRVRKAAVERIVAAPEAWRVADALIEALADGENPGRRNAAVEALVHCGSRAVPALLGATRSDDVDVRKLVVDALAGIGDERGTACLVQLLADADPNVRAAAADALGGLGAESALPALLALAVRPEEEGLVRFSALRALARLEVPLCADQLAGALDDPWLRPAAFSALGRADDAEAIEWLLKGLATASRSAREAAMAALLRAVGRLDQEAAEQLVARIRGAAQDAEGLLEDALERLAGAELATRLVLIQFLGLLRSEEAVLPILAAARDEALHEVSLGALEALGAGAERVLDRVWPELDTDLRRLGCELLGRIRGPGGAAHLVAALDDPDSVLRSTAARAIGRRGCVEALPSLVRRLASVAEEPDPDAEDELAAVTEALVSLAGPGADAAERAVALLAERVEGAGEAVRVAVATVLGRIGRPQDAHLVSFLLKDPSARVRRAAVEALARLEAGADSEPVRLALADESPIVRVAAASALGASPSPRALDDLERLAEDEDPWVRATAVRAVGAHGARDRGHAPLALLEAALADEGPVAIAAVEALRAIGGTVAAALCAKALGRPDPELLQAAVACVAEHGDAQSLAELLPLVSHPHWAVRAEAIGAIGERGVTKAVPSILRRLEIEQDDFVRSAILRALDRLER